MRTPLLHRYGQWWPVLLGFAAMGLVYFAAAFDKLDLIAKGPNENVALILLGISVVGFLIQALLFRSQFHLLMVVLCAGLFCREWHFTHSSLILYVAFALSACWFFWQRELFGRLLAKSQLKIWLVATLATYALSQLISRRLFRHLHLPAEGDLHIYMEETVETTAHLIMVVVCILAFAVGSAMLKRRRSKNT